MEYTVRVSKEWYRSDVIPVYKVAEAMARHAANGHGPTLTNIRPNWYSLLLDDAKKGKLQVCNEVGRIASAQDLIQASSVAPALIQLIQASSIPPARPEEDQIHALYVKVKHLNEWGASNGDVFHVRDSPGKVTISDLKDWETGKVIEAGYYRSYVDFGYEPEKLQAATDTPEVNVPAQKADTVPAPVTGNIVTVSDAPAATVAPVPTIEPAVALPDASVMDVSASKPAASGTVTHSTKAPPRDTLTPVIELAQSKCRNPLDTAEVWAQMEVLALNEEKPLLAITALGLKYTKGDKSPYFTRDALDKRLHPEKRGKPGKRR